MLHQTKPGFPTVYRALLKSAVSRTGHRIHTTKKKPGFSQSGPVQRTAHDLHRILQKVYSASTPAAQTQDNYCQSVGCALLWKQHAVAMATLQLWYYLCSDELLLSIVSH